MADLTDLDIPTFVPPKDDAPAPPETVEIAPPADGEPGGTAADIDEVAVQEAKAAGWVPREEWKGPASKWKPADEFLTFRDSVLPLVQKENRTLRSELSTLRATVAELKAAETERAQRSESLAIETAKYEKQQAAEIGDWKKVGELDDKLAELRGKRQEAPKPPAIDPQTNEIWTNFVARNDWVKDPERVQVLTETMLVMRNAGSQLPGEQLLEKAKDRVRRLYPEWFASGRRENPPALTDPRGANGAARSNSRILMPETC